MPTAHQSDRVFPGAYGSGRTSTPAASRSRLGRATQAGGQSVTPNGLQTVQPLALFHDGAAVGFWTTAHSKPRANLIDPDRVPTLIPQGEHLLQGLGLAVPDLSTAEVAKMSVDL